MDTISTDQLAAVAASMTAVLMQQTERATRRPTMVSLYDARSCANTFWNVFDALREAQERDTLHQQHVAIGRAVWAQIDDAAKVLGIYLYRCLREAYRNGGLMHHPSALRSRELIAIRGIGVRSVSRIRALFPPIGES